MEQENLPSLKKLEKILKIPLIHLDKYYHKPNWEEPEKEEWENILHKLVKQKRWIMDGNYADIIRYSISIS